MTNRIRIIKHEVTPDCGSYEVQIPGRPSKYFYWDDVPAWRFIREDLSEREQALEKAKAAARKIERRIDKALRAKQGPKQLDPFPKGEDGNGRVT
jgi:hypothetical protein